MLVVVAAAVCLVAAVVVVGAEALTCLCFLLFVVLFLRWNGVFLSARLGAGCFDFAQLCESLLNVINSPQLQPPILLLMFSFLLWQVPFST